MQIIIENIQNGVWNQQQLLEALLAHESENINEYNTALDEIEIRDTEIDALKKTIKANELHRIQLETIKFEAVKEAQRLHSDNIKWRGQLKDYKDTLKLSKTQFKKIGTLNENIKKLNARNDKQMLDNREQRADIAKNRSDIARLRMTGHKNIGKYSFHLFPSKVTVGKDNGEIEQQINLVVMNPQGAMKIIGVDDMGEVNQPKSHNFKFDDEQTDFITSFALVAKQDKWQFSDRVLSMIN